jgi:RNA polymerase sporulation-specific sigma factor
MTDETLVQLAKSGNKDAMNEVIERYKIDAKRIARSYFIMDGDSEDLIQEAMIGIYNAVLNYNGETNFKTFANVCIKRRLITVLKKSLGKKNLPLSTSIPLIASKDGNNSIEIQLSADVLTPEAELINNEAEKELLASIKKTLSVFEYEVLSIYLQGYSYVEIGEKMDIKTKAVDNAIQRIRKKINNLLVK